MAKKKTAKDEPKDVPAPAAAPRVIDAEGNDPDPYSKAVKDVVLDPKFTPAVVDPTRPASEVAEEAAGDVQTGSSRAVTDKRGTAPAAPAVPATRGAKRDATKDGSKDLSKTQAIRSPGRRSAGKAKVPARASNGRQTVKAGGRKSK